MLPDKALNTYKQLLTNHLTPDHHTISTLIHAYSKARQPWKAQEIFDTLFALHNLEPDVIAWNGLLGAFALAGHKVQQCCNSNVTCSICRLSLCGCQLSHAACSDHLKACRLLPAMHCMVVYGLACLCVCTLILSPFCLYDVEEDTAVQSSILASQLLSCI